MSSSRGPWIFCCDYAATTRIKDRNVFHPFQFTCCTDIFFPFYNIWHLSKLSKYLLKIFHIYPHFQVTWKRQVFYVSFLFFFNKNVWIYSKAITNEMLKTFSISIEYAYSPKFSIHIGAYEKSMHISNSQHLNSIIKLAFRSSLLMNKKFWWQASSKCERKRKGILAEAWVVLFIYLFLL